MLEHQVEYLVRLLDAKDASQLDRIDVRRDVMDDFNAKLQDVLDEIEVWQASCIGCYRSASGRIVTKRPYDFARYGALVDRDGPASFEGDPRSRAVATP